MRQARASRKRTRPKPPPPPEHIVRLATAIADRLFTRADGVRADRVALVDRENLYLSGWGDGPMRDVIIDELMNGGHDLTK